MEWVETTGRSVEEAKDAALDQLGVDEQDAEFEVVEEPRTGLFGRTRGEARVRARVAPRAHRQKQNDRPRRRGRGAQPDAGPKGGRGGGRGGRDRGRGPAGSRSEPMSDAPSSGAEAPAGRTGPAARHRPSTEVNQPSAKAGPGEGKANMDEVVTVERQAEIMEGFVNGLLDAFGLDGDLSSRRVDDETIELDVTGDDLGLLIGPKGQTLQAVQDLARTVVQRREPGPHEGRVRIDVGGYRQRRREALARFVTDIATDVRSTGERKALEPMGAADRKIVHDTVNALDGVGTTSEGLEPERWVVILPEAG